MYVFSMPSEYEYYAMVHVAFVSMACAASFDVCMCTEVAFMSLIFSSSLCVQVANEIRHLLKDYTKTIPTVLEIPSKDLP